MSEEDLGLQDSYLRQVTIDSSATLWNVPTALLAVSHQYVFLRGFVSL